MPIRFILVLVLCALGSTLSKRQPGPQLRKELSQAELEHIQALWTKYGPDYGAFKANAYPCGPLPKSSSVPTTVHALRPGDIKVVGAMGDSLTAGTGIKATNIFGLLTQNRGLSWSGGGQTDFEDQITIPNIVKKYNPTVYGYSVGDGDEDSTKSRLNVAVSGSESDDLVNQAVKLVERMRTDPNVDFANDWKLVTILSGNNDLCSSCKDPDRYNPQKYYENTIAALDILHAELPRTLVNLVEPLNMEIVTDLNKGLLCSALHFFGCECAAFPDDADAEMRLIQEADAFQLVVEQVGLSGRYDTKDDFTVVYQPFFNKTYLPRQSDGEPDMSYFAPDCFHLSRKGQAAAASGLWNNMVESINIKKTSWAPGEPIECPTEDQPFIFTNKNGKKTGSDRTALKRGQSSSSQHSSQHSTGTRDNSASSGLATALAIAGVVVASVATATVIVLVRKRFRRRAYDVLST